ncbi:sulfatase family protein [Pelagicoccus mobilis]|uniref:Sulfatase n=1 Tax=Pelagicoccus mobilis TaxID=415221 RepID=A0A934VL69_9BACT|nr:sulfatase [Pelagicoccus mobilis]MBK1877446.1 sulfatase [Pelagicoccus mobilis]
MNSVLRYLFSSFTSVSAGLTFVWSIAAASAEAAKRPNILFIMSDDHATNAISAYGSHLTDVFKTPNIDRLAKEGIRMDRTFCVNAICTPSRASILTGQYGHINGVKTLRDPIPADAINVADLLRKGGFQTALIGKWHLHTEPFGFDYWKVGPGQGYYHDPIFLEKGTPYKTGRDAGPRVEGYYTDLITDYALDWLENWDESKPFALFLHHKAPHGRWEPADRHKSFLEDVELPEPDSLWEDFSHRSEATRDFGTSISHRLADRRNMIDDVTSPKWAAGPIDVTGMTETEKTKAAYQKYVKDYLRCVKAVDENIGRVLEYLEESGLEENTLVIYTSDQGMFLGEHDYFDKRWIYEEAFRMPFIARLPGNIPAGSHTEALCANIDFAPTLLSYAGLPVPEEMQGKGFRSILETGKQPEGWRESVYYRYWMHLNGHHNPGHFGVRTDRYKLIFIYGLPLGSSGAVDRQTPAGWEFYDLEKDPNEINNSYNNPEYRAVIEELKLELLRLKDEYQDGDEAYPDLQKVIAEHWN